MEDRAGGIFPKGSSLSWHLGCPWRRKVNSDEGQDSWCFRRLMKEDSYCTCQILLSGFVRVGEGCFRLCRPCLENARIIMTIVGEKKERPIGFGNESSRW